MMLAAIAMPGPTAAAEQRQDPGIQKQVRGEEFSAQRRYYRRGYVGRRFYGPRRYAYRGYGRRYYRPYPYYAYGGYPYYSPGPFVRFGPFGFGFGW
jgi:hypothetical protein